MADPLAAKIEELLDKGVPEADIEAMSAEEILGPGPWRDGYVKPGKPGVPRLPDPPEPKKPGFLARFMDSPVDTLESLPGVREAGAFMKGANDRFTLGLWPMLERAIGTEDESRGLAEASPDAYALGQGTGMGLSLVALPGAQVPGAMLQAVPKVAPAVMGPAGATGKALEAIVKAKAPDLAAKALGRVGTATTAGTALGAAEGGAEGAGAGGLFGLGGALLGEAARAGSKLLRRDNWIGEYASGKDVDAYDSPELRSMSRGEKGIQEAADRAQLKIAARNSEKLGEAGKAHGEAVDAALAAQPEHDVAPVVNKLVELSTKNRTARSGRVLNQGLEDAIQDAFDMMDIDPATGKALGRDLISARRALEKKAQFGAPVSKENLPYREIYGSFREAIRQSSKEIAAADDAYAAQMTQSERMNDILHGTDESSISRGVRESGEPDVRAAKERTGAARLRRTGDDTVAGTVEARQLDELANMDQEYADAIRLLRLKKAQEATAIGGSKVPSSLPSLLQFPGSPLIEQNLRFIGGRLLEPALSGSASIGAELWRGTPYAIDPIFNLLSGAEVQRRKNERKDTE